MPTTEPTTAAPGRRAVLKGATATVLLHLLMTGPARAAAHGAASPDPPAGLHIVTYLAVDPTASVLALDLLRGLDLWASAMPTTSTALLAVGSGPGDAEATAAWYGDAASDADVLVAPYGSPLTQVAFDVAEDRHVPCIAPSAGEPDLWAAGRRWSVALLEPTPTFFDGALELAARHTSAIRGDVALVYRDDPFSRSVMAGAARTARALDFTRVVHHRFHDARERTAAARAPRSGAVLGIGYQPGTAGEGFLDDAVAIARAVPRAGTGFIALGVGAADPAFGAVAGAAAEDVVGVTGWRPYLPTPGNRAFVDAFRARWHREPTAHVAQGYAAGQVLERASRLLASSDRGPRDGSGAGARATRNEALRDALHALDTSTVFGRYRVDASGRQVGHRPALVRWRDGRVSPLEAPHADGPSGDGHRSGVEA